MFSIYTCCSRVYIQTTIHIYWWKHRALLTRCYSFRQNISTSVHDYRTCIFLFSLYFTMILNIFCLLLPMYINQFLFKISKLCRLWHLKTNRIHCCIVFVECLPNIGSIHTAHHNMFKWITIITGNTFRSFLIIKQIIMSKLLIYNGICDIWSRLLVPSDYDGKNKESCQLCNVFRGIFFINLLVPTVLLTF